ncbi:phosphopantetheine-binding protein [Frateuria sp.]|uniref:phosphopantetheine-binding protein n=1 Tax=Frateuria sp. TaxID=2211372 RepID=UPI001827F62C|nr:phosphopantetheine-binding protein [Frateuria sp.]NUR22907.1 acyl carrier protein [Frateuria sp.]
MTTPASATGTSAPDLALEAELAEMIVSGLNLDVAATDIQPEAPLYGDGLGLDSIDILEIALVISKKYGLQIKADSADNFEIFSSLRNLAAYIAKNRAT